LNSIHRRQAEHLALLRFQKDEISGAGIVAGEDSELEQERLRLKNAEMLYQIVYGSIEALYGASGSVIERLLGVRKNLERAGQIESRLKTSADSLAESAYQIEDLIEQLRSYLKLIQMDDQRLEAVEERLDMLNKLKRKYGGSLAAVLSKLAVIARELSDVENISEKIAATEKKLSDLNRRCAELARQLSRQRKKAAENLAAKVSRELASLKMAQTVFDAGVQPIPWNEKSDPHLKVEDQSLSETGIDRAVFMIAPNIGEELKPLAGIASGGELSRVILALKAILAETDSVETVVFDEVDAGIGGGTAEVVGRKLSELGKHHQIICITHLAQIAKFGKHHFSISKHVADGRTHTVIRPLSKKDRYQEIARMLGGEEITQATLNHARELLEK
jgi:DNA repair protein RecN (Recombination protein N)